MTKLEDVSDPWLQNQLTQVELRSLKSHFMGLRRESGKLIIGDLASKMSRMKAATTNLLHTISETEKASYGMYMLFAKKLINVAVPGTIDE
ncbi:hypothetical protein K1719_028266 [Acacia pycnantha]|nr:hypothetical protein K1719_028266 [Acacia pycnantha]